MQKWLNSRLITEINTAPFHFTPRYLPGLFPAKKEICKKKSCPNIILWTLFSIFKIYLFTRDSNIKFRLYRATQFVERGPYRTTYRFLSMLYLKQRSLDGQYVVLD